MRKKKQIKKRYFMLCLILGCLISIVGCNRITQGDDLYFSYRENPFRAEICGQMNGIRFSAKIGKDQITEGTPLVGAYIDYLTPQALQNIHLYSLGNGDFHIESDTLSNTFGEPFVKGWIRPLLILLKESNIQKIRKESGVTILTLPQGELQLSSIGQPISFHGENISFDILWWESGYE